MTSDPAAFDRSALIAIYGEWPCCFITTSRQILDVHHILSRGYHLGANKKSKERKVFSSVFNCAFLTRSVHSGPFIDSPEMRRLLLRVAREHVMNAVNFGTYDLAEYDRAFLTQAETWLAENPC